MKPLLTTIVLASLAGATVASAEPRPVSFRDAIALTLTESPDLALARTAIDRADNKAASVRAKRLPVLRVEATGNLYTEPYQVDFAGQPFTLHDRVTTFAQVRLAQPLTGLVTLSQLLGAAQHDAAAARADYDRSRLAAAYATAEAFVRVLEARATADVAHQSVVDIAGSLDRAQKLRLADTLTNVDVLRLRSAKAAADQASVRADTTSEVAIAQLALTIGLAEYLPDLRAVAVYQHTTGAEPFQPTDEEWVALTVSWNVWDWGGIRASARDAEHTRARAQLTASATQDQVRFDVRRRWLEAKAGFDNLASAQVQLESAEEAFRLQRVKFDAAAATTTDVLDAETDVARAPLQSALARDDYYLGLVALARAVGDLPRVK